MKKTLYLILAVIVSIAALYGCTKNKKDEEIENPETVITENENINSDLETGSDKKEEEKVPEEIKKPSADKENAEENKPSNNPPVETPNNKELSISEVMNKIVSVIPEDKHNMSELPKELYADLYGIDTGKFEDVLVFGSMMNVKANEIMLLKVKDIGDIESATKLLEERKNQVYKTWENYLPDQFEMVKQAKIKTNGKYAVLIISPNSDKVSDAFMKL